MRKFIAMATLAILVTFNDGTEKTYDYECARLSDDGKWLVVAECAHLKKWPAFLGEAISVSQIRSWKTNDKTESPK